MELSRKCYEALPEAFGLRIKAPALITPYITKTCALRKKTNGSSIQPRVEPEAQRISQKCIPKNCTLIQARDHPVSVYCHLKDRSATESPRTDLNVIKLKTFLSFKSYQFSH